MARVVILGAGLAGLAAAARLADLRHDVTVLESSADVGGQIAGLTLERATVELGPSTFTMPAPLRELFRATGRPIEREVDLVPVEPSMHVVFGDGSRADIPNASRAGTIRALDEALGPGAGAQWDVVVRHGGQLWQRLRPYLLGHTRRGARGDDPSGEAMARHLHDPRLRALLGWYAAGVGDDSAHPPDSAAMLAYLEQTFGTWTATGGLRTVVDALRRRAVERGAVIRTATPVTAVDVGGRNVSGVRLADGTVLDADVVVSAIQPSHLAAMVPGGLPASARLGRARIVRRRTEARAGAGRSSFGAVLRTDAALTAAGTADRIAVPPTAEHPAMTLHRGSPSHGAIWVLDADGAPHGHEPGALDWAAPGVADAHAAALLGPAARALGTDTGQVTVDHVRTPLDLERQTGAPGGRVYGTPAKTTVYPGRPDNRTRIRGLFLAGAGAHPGPGVAMSVISAGIVADLIGRA